MPRPLFFLLASLLSAAQLPAQNPVRTGKDYALFFVVQDFDHWQDLSAQSVAQVRDIESELKTHYGFRTEFVLNPTRQQVIDKLNAYGKSRFGPQDQLLVYFSMHGHYEEGRIGALIPKDGLLRDNAYQTWIMHPLLEDLVSAIPCEHLTLALDACYSGTFEGGRGKPEKPAYQPGDDCASKAENALRYKSRLYLTSGGKERTPVNSQFADKWLDALRTRNADGVLSYNDLAGIVEEASPIPRFGEFKGHQKGGNFVFVHRDICNTTAKTDADNQHWLSLQVNPARSQILEHLRLYPTCRHYQQALALLDEPEAPTDLPGMVFVKGGDFQMGSADGMDNEKPVHRVMVSDFYIGVHELTFDEYDAFCASTGRDKPSDRGWGRGKRPVINVSWIDAVEYCNWRSEKEGLQKVYTISGSTVTANWNANGYRLPTEAEWEYAARSRGRDEKWAGTSRESSLSRYGNFCDKNCSDKLKIENQNDGYPNTAPVGSFRANALGLFDMSGNVWEWCWDWFDGDYYGKSASRDPQGPDTASGRVLRGGSWVELPSGLCCASRFAGTPDYGYDHFGFRLARAAR